MTFYLFLRYSLFIAAGGAIGAMARFWMMELFFTVFHRDLPWGTLIVNVTGSFLMGFLSVYLFEKFGPSNELRSFILVGILGGYTTFSSFSLDAIGLLSEGKTLAGCSYILLSVMLCLMGTLVGIRLAS
jgi:CrcB protein